MVIIIERISEVIEIPLAWAHPYFWLDQGEAPPSVPAQWGMGFFKGPSALILLSIFLSMIYNIVWGL